MRGRPFLASALLPVPVNAASSPLNWRLSHLGRALLLPSFPGPRLYPRRCSGPLLLGCQLPLSWPRLGLAWQFPTRAGLEPTRGGSRRHPWCGSPGLGCCTGRPLHARTALPHLPQVPWRPQWAGGRCSLGGTFTPARPAAGPRSPSPSVSVTFGGFPPPVPLISLAAASSLAKSPHLRPYCSLGV